MSTQGTLQCMVPAEEPSSQLRRGVLPYCVLALLARDDSYGFDLVRALGAVEGMVTSEGTIYPLLARLVRDEFVTTTWRDSPTGPPRKYYALTAKGRRALGVFHADWDRFRTAVDTILSEGATP